MLKRILLPVWGALMLAAGLSWTQAAGAVEGESSSRDRVRGSVGLLFSLAPLAEGFQYIHAGGLAHDPTAENGAGFTLDFADRRGNSFALDYYTAAEEASRTYALPPGQTGESSYSDIISLTGPMLGYRYHYPMGFYSGVGFWYPTVAVGRDDRPGGGRADINYSPELIPVFQLGVNGRVAGGFTVGAHILYSFAATLELASDNDRGDLAARGYLSGGGELTDVQLTALFLKLGYSW